MTWTVARMATDDEPRGYKDRQKYANSIGATVYLELHYNAKKYDRPGMQDNPASVLVANNASRTSRSIAADIAQCVADAFGFASGGVDVLSDSRRGYYNLVYTAMPACLLEPLWVSDEEQAILAASADAQRTMAEIICDTLRTHFPNGGLLALSVGHLNNPSRPGDRGAPCAIGGVSEADLALLLSDAIERELAEDGAACKCPNCGAQLKVELA